MAIAYGDSLLLNLGLLLVRVIFGLLMAAHGSQKLFGWLGGYGLAGTGGFFETLGFRPGKQFATVASLSEFIGGLLFTFGFLGPIGPALILAVMLVASISVHLPNGLFAATNGVEVPVLYATAVIGIALIGFGSYSLDSALGFATFWTPALIAIALIVGVVGGLANLMLRRHPPTTPAV
ncbi:MAG TPA: DoxX family protein [Gemmatimonadaceae bacterium]|nr:DoxX family protein [Gemmatimonadaceae bacterium]